MDPTQEPGIRLVGVFVERVRFDDIPASAPKPENLHYTIRLERRRAPDDGFGEVVVHLALRASDTTQSPFQLDVSVAGRFAASSTPPNMSLDEFMHLNAPAQVMPFVRELVANVTARSRYGIVLLPSINVIALVRREEQLEKSRDAAAP